MDFHRAIQSFEAKYPAISEVRQERLFDPDKPKTS